MKANRALSTIFLIGITAAIVLASIGIIYLIGFNGGSETTSLEQNTDTSIPQPDTQTDPITGSGQASSEIQTSTDLPISSTVESNSTITLIPTEEKVETPNQTHSTTSLPTTTAIITTTETHTEPPTVTNTNTPTSTLTSTSEDPTSHTQTPESENKTTPERYYPFLYSYLDKLNRSSRVPINLMGIRVENDQMWVIHNGTSPQINDTRMRMEWSAVATGYLEAWGDHELNDLEGEKPDRMRAVQFNASNVETNENTFFVLSSNAEAYWNDKITLDEYSSRWFDTIREPTEREQRIGDAIAGDTANKTYYPPGWNESHDNTEKLHPPDFDTAAIAGPYNRLNQQHQFEVTRSSRAVWAGT